MLSGGEGGFGRVVGNGDGMRRGLGWCGNEGWADGVAVEVDVEAEAEAEDEGMEEDDSI
jgi:hypothetical protein